MKMNEITLASTSDDVPDPYLKISDFDVPESAQDLMQRFDKPKPIQALCWPMALKGMDIVGIAQTGSGKTLGFILPGLIHCLEQDLPPTVGPKMMVICNTRELARQTQSVGEPFEKRLGLTSMAVYGGEDRLNQLRNLKNGVDIIYGTPGRLTDFVKEGNLELSYCSYAVVDEADRLMDQGFKNQLESLMNQLRPDRQTLMFSATWPDTIQRFARTFTNESNKVTATVGSKILKANGNIAQIVEIISPLNRIRRISDVMRDNQGTKTLIFASSRNTVDALVNLLKQNGFACVSVHAGKTQGERDAVIQSFRTGEATVLVATDVAARGFDVEDIELVINYEMPTEIEEYVHRIGRTARGDRDGMALTFLSPLDYDKAQGLVDILERAGQAVPSDLRKISMLSLTRRSKGYGVDPVKAARQRYSYGLRTTF